MSSSGRSGAPVAGCTRRRTASAAQTRSVRGRPSSTRGRRTTMRRVSNCSARERMGMLHAAGRRPRTSAARCRACARGEVARRTRYSSRARRTLLSVAAYSRTCHSCRTASSSTGQKHRRAREAANAPRAPAGAAAASLQCRRDRSLRLRRRHPYAGRAMPVAVRRGGSPPSAGNAAEGRRRARQTRRSRRRRARTRRRVRWVRRHRLRRRPRQRSARQWSARQWSRRRAYR